VRQLVAGVMLAGAVVTPLAQAPDPDGWRVASPDYVLRFPADHASHPEYRVEWWYYTGNLQADDGRRFGFQVTFFRVGVDPAPANPSRWAVRDLHMAHLALTDVASGLHLVDERLNRAGVGWAGANTERLEVWNDDWRAELRDGVHQLTARSGDGDFGVDLRLDPVRGPTLHGQNGFSQKGAAASNASHYYSLTRLETTGSIVVDGTPVAVAGLSWMDHEFGTTFLDASQLGWDWFSLQLDDGTDVMLYRLRQTGDRVDPRSSGTIVLPDGDVRRLDAAEFRLTPARDWTSPASGARYPVDWRLELPSAGLDLTVSAVVDAQELRTPRSTGVTYWEGTVVVGGSRDGTPVTGRGYLEMTGYAGRPMGDVFAGPVGPPRDADEDD